MLSRSSAWTRLTPIAPPPSPTGGSTGGAPEFLLVTMTGEERRWTFPKGRRDDGDETLADTALREAREEAGVAGRIDRRPLAEYLFPWLGGETLVVAAFLLEVTEEAPEEREGKDARRERVWCSYEEALEAIGVDDDAAYRDEMARVLRAAVEALGAGG